MADVLVTLSIFSGNPDPAWELSGGDPELIALEAALAPYSGPSTASPPTPPGLGYRGFLVKKLTSSTPLPDLTISFCNTLEIIQAGGTNDYADVTGVESLLIGQASARGFGSPIAQSRTCGSRT